MKQKMNIPQHDLATASGKPASIAFEDWGTVLRYNIQHVHRHNFHEILFFRAGAGVHDIDFTTWKIQPGAVHFVASENVHLLVRDKHTYGSSLMFTQDVISPEILSRLPFGSPRPVMHLDVAQMALADTMLGIIRAEWERDSEAGGVVIRAQMQALLLYLSGIGANSPYSVSNPTPAIVTSFKHLLQKQFRDHINVNGYADQLHVSPKHLIDLCKKHTGKTPLQLIKEYTVAEAKRLLYNTDLSVKQVAYELNFDDPANFSKYFKSVCGYSPADYRKEGK
jgi:AraC-like DNA-binding protein